MSSISSRRGRSGTMTLAEMKRIGRRKKLIKKTLLEKKAPAVFAA